MSAVYCKGERVYVRHTYGLTQPEWRTGIITEVFLAPITNTYVIVVAGNGYYEHEVRPDDGNRDADGTLLHSARVPA
jgi:hypothetical protein